MHLAQVNIFGDFFRHNPNAAGFDNPGTLISILVPNILIAAGVFLFVLIIYAGYQLITLGGQFNSPQAVAKAKSMVTYALIGFLLVVSAYFILQIISTVTGVNFMNANVT